MFLDVSRIEFGEWKIAEALIPVRKSRRLGPIFLLAHFGGVAVAIDQIAERSFVLVAFVRNRFERSFAIVLACPRSRLSHVGERFGTRLVACASDDAANSVTALLESSDTPSCFRIVSSRHKRITVYHSPEIVLNPRSGERPRDGKSHITY